jgi:hypothetical protein
MKRRILCALMGLALIASLGFTSFASPREASALPTVTDSWPSACEVLWLHFREAVSTGDERYAWSLVHFLHELGCF